MNDQPSVDATAEQVEAMAPFFKQEAGKVLGTIVIGSVSTPTSFSWFISFFFPSPNPAPHHPTPHPPHQLLEMAFFGILTVMLVQYFSTSRSRDNVLIKSTLVLVGALNLATTLTTVVWVVDSFVWGFGQYFPLMTHKGGWVLIPLSSFGIFL
jgi:hypothetical protein